MTLLQTVKDYFKTSKVWSRSLQTSSGSIAIVERHSDEKSSYVSLRVGTTDSGTFELRLNDSEAACLAQNILHAIEKIDPQVASDQSKVIKQ